MLVEVTSLVERQPLAAAQATVLNMAGLDSGLDLTTYDPAAVANDPGATDAARLQARKVQATNVVLSGLIAANRNTINANSPNGSASASNALAVYHAVSAGSGGAPPLRNIARAVSAAIDRGLEPDAPALVAGHTIAADEVMGGLEAVKLKLAGRGAPAPQP